MATEVKVLAGCNAPDFHPAHCNCFPTTCVFCEIARTGDAEGFQRYGSTVVSFVPLNPVVPGHRLFIPVRHATDIAQDPGYGAPAFYQAGRWGAQQDEDFNLITSRGSLATQTIFHTHVHYVPRRNGDGLKLPWTGQHG